MKKALGFIFLLLLAAVGSLVIGSVNIPPSEVFAALTGGETEKESWRYIILQSRLPQTITAMLCGSSLAAFIHLARTQARTAERRLWTVNGTHHLEAEILAFMNRLSDYLFLLALEHEQ